MRFDPLIEVLVMSSSHLTITPLALASLPRQEAIFEINLPSGLLQDEDMYVLSALGEVKVALQKQLLLCQGSIDVVVRTNCSRTGEPFESDLKVTFKEWLEVVERSRQLPSELELSLDDASEQISHEDPLDILELIRQYVILNLPTQNTSSESCYNDYSSQESKTSSRTLGDHPSWEAIRAAVIAQENENEDKKEVSD